MDTSCCSLSVKVVFQHSSRLGNRPRCKVPFNQDIAFPSFTAISSDKASFLPNAQYHSLACAASLSVIQTQQENTFARASSVTYFGQKWWDRHLACLSRNDRQDACPTNTVDSNAPCLSPVRECAPRFANWTTKSSSIAMAKK